MLAFLLIIIKTSQGMEELIKLTFSDNQTALGEISEGNYELRDVKEHAVILPKLWDTLVQPELKVEIQLSSQNENSKDKSDSKFKPDRENESEGKETEKIKEEEAGEFETEYKVKIRYTVNYYEKDTFRENVSLRATSSYDEPVVLETSRDKPRQLPVMEVKVNITSPNRGGDIYSAVFPGRASSGSKNSNGVAKDTNSKPKLNADDKIGNPDLHIYSPWLLNTLRLKIKYSSMPPSGDSDNLKDGVFPYPYNDLYYHKEELLQYKKDGDKDRKRHSEEYNAMCDCHIDLLIDFLYDQPAIGLKAIEAHWDMKVPTTTFGGFLLLMKPGSDVYVQENDMLNAYVVDRVKGGVLHKTFGSTVQNAAAYCVVVWNLAFNGNVIKRISKEIEVPVFDNEREIRSLPLFPTRFQDSIDDGARRQSLIKRGKNYFSYSKGPSFLEFSGRGLRPGWKTVIHLLLRYYFKPTRC